MYYSQIEEYKFTMPSEYKAYLAFKENLKESGVIFTEGGGNTIQSIEIRTNGRFKVSDDGTFDKEVDIYGRK